MNTEMGNEMTLGQWIVTLLIVCVPCVNIVMLFIWAFGNGTYPAKKTFAQAYLILAAIAIVIYIIFFAIFGASFVAMMNSLATYGLFML